VAVRRSYDGSVRGALPVRRMASPVLWWRAPAGGAQAAPPPLVVLVAWMHAQPRHVAAYAALYRRLGAEVCAVLPPALHMWLEGRSLVLATRLADELTAELRARGARPVLLASFSGGPKACTSRLLQVRPAASIKRATCLILTPLLLVPAGIRARERGRRCRSEAVHAARRLPVRRVVRQRPCRLPVGARHSLPSSAWLARVAPCRCALRRRGARRCFCGAL
jgi:hypothetical protein